MNHPAQVWILGVVQCVYWGVLFYAFSVLLVPVAAELHASQALVAGAFSAGLLVSALLAPAVGRALDRGHGALLIRAGSLGTPLLLVGWSTVDSVLALYAVWIGLGACMALVLYESSFALVVRAFADPQQRLRALATVTVVGGLASTLFLPLAGWGVASVGWRGTLYELALAWLLASWLLERSVLATLRDAVDPLSDTPAHESTAPAPMQPPREPDATPATWIVLATPFVLATFAGMTLTTLLIPMLVAQGHELAGAAMVLGALGLMQLPGRAWLLRGGAPAAPAALLALPVLLQAAGLVLAASAQSLALACAGVALFGLGAGVFTLARPWAVSVLFPIQLAGLINGRIARAQGFARALGPVAAATLMATTGAPAAFVLVAAMLLATLPLARRSARRATLRDALPAVAASRGRDLQCPVLDAEHGR